MSLFRDRLFTRLALVGVAVTALALAGCGRKGPLDPPPGASMASGPQPAAQPVGPVDPLAAPMGQPRDNAIPQVRAADPNKKFLLDSILN